MTKIRKIEVFPLTIPYREVSRLSYGIEAETNNVIVKIYAEGGVVGFGESCAIKKEMQSTVLNDLFKTCPKLIGMGSFGIAVIHDKMDEIVPDHNHGPGKAAIDMALYDIMGKLARQPVYNLIGGCYRRDIPTQHALFVKEPEEMAAEAKSLMQEGYTIFEIKLGGEPEKDIERARRIREAVGKDVVMIIDPNQGWTPQESIYCLKQMRGLDVICEEPTAGIDGLAEVHRAVDTPLVVDQSAPTPKDVIEVVRKKAGDMMNIKIQSAGGIYPSLKITSICEAAGMKYRIDDGPVSRIGNTASAHFAAASRDIVGCGVAQHTFLDAKTVDLISEDGVRIERGFGIVPSGYGLGITVKDDLLRSPKKVFA